MLIIIKSFKFERLYYHLGKRFMRKMRHAYSPLLSENAEALEI